MHVYICVCANMHMYVCGRLRYGGAEEESLCHDAESVQARGGHPTDDRIPSR